MRYLGNEKPPPALNLLNAWYQMSPQFWDASETKAEDQPTDFNTWLNAMFIGVWAGADKEDSPEAMVAKATEECDKLITANLKTQVVQLIVDPLEKLVLLLAGGPTPKWTVTLNPAYTEEEEGGSAAAASTTPCTTDRILGLPPGTVKGLESREVFIDPGLRVRVSKMPPAVAATIMPSVTDCQEVAWFPVDNICETFGRAHFMNH